MNVIDIIYIKVYLYDYVIVDEIIPIYKVNKKVSKD